MSSRKRKQAARAARTQAAPAPSPTPSSAAPAAARAGTSDAVLAPDADAARVSRGLFWAMVVFAVAIPLYFLVLTHAQPVWWDEAEYLVKGKSIALGTPETGWFSARPLLLPLTIAGVYGLGMGELAVRVLIALSSVAAMLLTYRIGRRMAGDFAGFAAGVLLGCFYIVPFYGSRIMTEVPHMALTLLAVDLLISGAQPGALRRLLGAPAALALATLMRFTAALLAPVLVVWALVAARKQLRTLLVAAAIGVAVLAPYLIWSAVTYGDPMHAWKAQQYLMDHPDFASRLAGVARYATWLTSSLGWLLGVLLTIGLVLSARWIIKPRALWRNEDPDLGHGLLLWLWILVPLLYFGAVVRNWEDRYVVLLLPPVFIAIGRTVGVAATMGAALVQRRRSLVALAVTVALTLVGAIGLFGDSDAMAKRKLESFATLRTAGTWLAANTPPDTHTICGNVAQLTYYSERESYPFPKDLEELRALRKEGRADYVVVTSSSRPPKWMEGVRANLVMKHPEEKPNVRIFALPTDL